MTTLKDSIVKKYNKLLTDVCVYYNIDITKLNSMLSSDLLYLETWEIHDKLNVENRLEVNYPFLLPFYKIFISIHLNEYQNKYINSETFREINEVMRKIKFLSEADVKLDTEHWKKQLEDAKREKELQQMIAETHARISAEKAKLEQHQQNARDDQKFSKLNKILGGM